MPETPATPAAAPSAPSIFDRELLRRRRDRAAEAIDRHDFLLRRAAEDIAERVAAMNRSFQAAVVVGACHGVLGRLLRPLPNVGLVIETESSWRLLARCDGPSVLADEEALPFAAGSLDLVVSALTLQHINDLPGTLAQIRRALKPDGLLLAAMLGGQTLQELRAAMLSAELETTGGASPRVAPFADVRDAGALLQRAGFALPVADGETLSVTYSSPLDLMRDLRGMGAGNVLVDRSRRPLRRDTLMRALVGYADRHGSVDGRIAATFEIVTLTGWAPHENQPKPLRPGSAKVRLADALRGSGREGGSGGGSGG